MTHSQTWGKANSSFPEVCKDTPPLIQGLPALHCPTSGSLISDYKTAQTQAHLAGACGTAPSPTPPPCKPKQTQLSRCANGWQPVNRGKHRAAEAGPPRG